MPRLDYRATAEHVLQLYEVKLVLAVLVEEINQLRTWAGQPELTTEHVRAKVRHYVRRHPKADLTGEGQ